MSFDRGFIMTNRSSTSRFLLLRASFGGLLLGLLGAAVLTGDSPAQNPNLKSPQTGQTPPKKRVEEEEDTKPKRKVIRVEEDEPKSPTPARPETALVIDLAQAARQAKHPAVKELFQTLAVPHDVVILKAFPGIEPKSREKRLHVMPIPQFVGDNPKAALPKKVELRPFDDEWRLQKSEEYSPTLIKSVQPYEVTALHAVQKFLENHFEKLPPPNNRYLSLYDQNYYAEQALAAVLRFHESARSREERRGEDWDEVQNKLRQLLFTVSLNQLQERVKEKDWEAAYELAQRFAEKYPNPADQEKLARPLAELLDEEFKRPGFQEDRYRKIRERLQQLARLFPEAKTETTSKQLQQYAQQRYQQAEQLKAEGSHDRARIETLYKEAWEIYPELPGLQAALRRSQNAYPILRVGVRELPEYLSPSMACTDNELRAVELLFESLVKASPDKDGFVRYQPGLAEGRPVVTPLGRQFQLPAQATWSNGKAVNGSDIRNTIRQWRQGHGTGLSPAWSDLFAEGVEVTSIGDPPRVTLHLRQGCPDPLALMTFKIVPQPAKVPPTSLQANGNEFKEEAFAHNPIGSGPYVFKTEEKSDGGRPCRIFQARYRAGRAVQPTIQEIRFYATSDPIQELEKGALDLALDLTPEQAAQLKQGRKDLRLVDPLALNRRVYFLAVNHRVSQLQHVAVRRALAYAINREQLLDEHFRKGLGGGYHHALNGPYPARSWALSPALTKGKDSLDPYDADLAYGLLSQEAKNVQRPIRLTLKYPTGDEVLAKALTALTAQVEQSTKGGIKLDLLPASPHNLRTDVEETQSYELAYYHYDFPDEMFWLGPLLGQRALPQGGNYLGYQGEASLQVQNTLSYRHFHELQQETRRLHEKLDKDMPLIPLWQLDPLIGLHTYVKTGGVFDPWRVFTDIERWSLQR
jgi:ABC-type oligopeptide transport system substrate-binding subunit